MELDGRDMMIGGTWQGARMSSRMCAWAAPSRPAVGASTGSTGATAAACTANPHEPPGSDPPRARCPIGSCGQALAPSNSRSSAIHCVGGLYLRDPPLDAVVDLMPSAEWSSCFLVAGDEERTVLMVRLIWITSIHTHDFLHRSTPTSVVLDKLRTRGGLKWGVPTILLAIPYLAVASILTILIGNGAPGWFHLLVLLCIWNTLKFLVMVPVSVVRPVRARTAERRDRRMLNPSPTTMA